ncbi:helix-turn-helix domain-containing protein [Amycolatopsis sp. NPDC059021]|uniref:AraC-like ligand-binding domain-containing protein n=1 Tax=Amycolatopsis sp. NPDC059021 TaxID=3346704 RepID=UPI00366F6F86
MGTTELARRTTAHGGAVLASARDADQVVEACTGTLRPHELRVARGGKLSARLAHVPVGDLSVNRLRYGTSVTVSPAVPEEDNFLLTLPVAGTAVFRYGGSAAPATPGHGVIVGPYREFEFTIDAEYDQVVVRLDRGRVESVAAAMTGTTGPVHFDLGLDAAVAQVDGLLETAVELAVSSLAAARPQLLWQLEQVIIESLLLSQPSNRSRALGPGAAKPPSARVRRAMDYLRDHLAEPVSIAAVAAECGVSVRSLQESFRRDLDTTPGQWLKAQRLDRAHALLAGGSEHVTVTEVAYACGFFHLGEFGAAFKARYGVTPSSLLTPRR